MDELFDISKTLVRCANHGDSCLAKTIAEWALPGDRFNESEGKFEQSGLSLTPFMDLVSFSRTEGASLREFGHGLHA